MYLVNVLGLSAEYLNYHKTNRKKNVASRPLRYIRYHHIFLFLHCLRTAFKHELLYFSSRIRYQLKFSMSFSFISQNDGFLNWAELANCILWISKKIIDVSFVNFFFLMEKQKSSELQPLLGRWATDSWCTAGWEVMILSNTVLEKPGKAD